MGFADEIAEKVLAGLGATLAPEGKSSVTLRILFERWADAHCDLASISTERWRASVLLTWEGFADVLALSVTQATVDAYRAYRATAITRRGGAPTVATVNREVMLLHRVLNFGVERGFIPRNPIHRVALKAENNVREVVVDEEGIESILRCIENAEAYAWTILAFESGMRRGELMRLCWRQLDWGTGRIRIPAAHTKNRRARSVEFPLRSREALRDLRQLEESPTVFTHHPRWLYELFCRAVKESGVTGIDGTFPTWHDLRRSYVTLMRRRGVQESVVMKLSGHRDRKVFERYNIVGDDEVGEAIRRNNTARERELSALRTGERRPAQKSAEISNERIDRQARA